MTNRRGSTKHAKQNFKWPKNCLRKKKNDYWGRKRGLGGERESAIDSWGCWEAS